MLAQYGLELALACAALAIIYGLYTTSWILKQDAGNDKMQAIAAARCELILSRGGGGGGWTAAAWPAPLGR